MRRLARKAIPVILIISVTVSILPPVLGSIIFASSDKKEAFDIWYDENNVGWITFQTYVKTGSTSSIRYRTIGVQVEWLEKGYKTLVRLREDQAEQIPDPNNPGYVTFRFRVPFVRANADPKTVGEPAFWNHSVMDNFVWEYRDRSNADAVKRDVLNFFFTGGNVRFYAIMTTVPPGSTSPKGSINYQARFSDPPSVKYTNPNDVYETLEEIQGAAPWSNPSDLEQYFEIIRYLNPQPISGAVISRYFEVRGNTITAILSDEVQTNHDLRLGIPNIFLGTYKDF